MTGSPRASMALQGRVRRQVSRLENEQVRFILCEDLDSGGVANSRELAIALDLPEREVCDLRTGGRAALLAAFKAEGRTFTWYELLAEMNIELTNRELSDVEDEAEWRSFGIERPSDEALDAMMGKALQIVEGERTRRAPVRREKKNQCATVYVQDFHLGREDESRLHKAVKCVDDYSFFVPAGTFDYSTREEPLFESTYKSFHRAFDSASAYVDMDEIKRDLLVEARSFQKVILKVDDARALPIWSIQRRAEPKQHEYRVFVAYAPSADDDAVKHLETWVTWRHEIAAIPTFDVISVIGAHPSSLTARERITLREEIRSRAFPTASRVRWRDSASAGRGDGALSGLCALSRRAAGLSGTHHAPKIVLYGHHRDTLPAARLLSQSGLLVVGIVGEDGGLVNNWGLEVERVQAHFVEHGHFHGYKAAEPCTKEAALSVDSDVFVPVSGNFFIGAGLARRVNCKIFIEGAAGCVSSEAEDELLARGVIVVPDLVSTAGTDLETYYSAQKKGRSATRRRVCQAVLNAFERVLDRSQQHGIALRTAAVIEGMKRRLKALSSGA